MPEKYPYYYKTWFVIFMLFLFFPVGLILMWKGSKFGKTSRIIISILGLLTLYPLRNRKQISSKKIKRI